jgi:hypothetical protein
MSERYKCKFCEKDYASMSARSNHVKKYHTQDVDKMYTNGIHSGIQSVYNSLTSDTSKQNNLCKYCNKKLSNRNSRWRHEKNCKGDNLLEKKEITQIQKASNIQNNIDNKKIVINNFGSNNLEHLSDKFKINLLKHFIIEEEYIEPIPKLIKNINFNPNHKENNNVKITSLRSKIGYKYTEKKWVAVDKNKLSSSYEYLHEFSDCMTIYSNIFKYLIDPYVDMHGSYYGFKLTKNAKLFNFIK